MKTSYVSNSHISHYLVVVCTTKQINHKGIKKVPTFSGEDSYQVAETRFELVTFGLLAQGASPALSRNVFSVNRNWHIGFLLFELITFEKSVCLILLF